MRERNSCRRKRRDNGRKKLIVALDVDDIKQAGKLVDELKSLVSIFKIGSRLFTAYGPEVVDMINRKGCRVFLDLKYHDIPTVIESAVRMAVRHEVFALTLRPGRQGDDGMVSSRGGKAFTMGYYGSYKYE